MPHTNLREMAFQSRADDLRQYSHDLLLRKPESEAAAEVLDLMAYLVECDFEAAEAKLATIAYRYKESKFETYVDEAIALAATHINFAYGRFDQLDKLATDFITKNKAKPNLEQGVYLDILRLYAQKSFLIDEYIKLEDTYKLVLNFISDEQSSNHFYLINSVKSMYLASRGDFLKAQEVAMNNIQIAKQNNYQGLMEPLDSMFVLALCKYAGAKIEEALKIFSKIKKISEKKSLWPWYFYSDGFFSRSYAYSNQIKEALAIVREQREKLSNFNFTHEMYYIPDINELYARHIIKDMERIEVLIGRVPNLRLVQEINRFQDQISGKNNLESIKSLPEESPSEKVYKLVSLAEYYVDKESLAINYITQALKIIEKTGQIEFILRQHKLFNIIQKAISKEPTAFLELIREKIAEHIQVYDSRNQKLLPASLTHREIEVIRHLSTGKSISSISKSLHVSMNTMKTHLRNIYRKLEVDGRENAVHRAKELFLI